MLAERGMPVTANPTLLMEVHNAHAESQDADVATVREICEELQSTTFTAVTDHTAAQSIWHIRHGTYEIIRQRYPHHNLHVADVAVPISRYPEIITFIWEQIAALDLKLLVGHAGDGNIHITSGYKNDAELEQIKAINGAIVHKAIELGGTATGEHGVGIGKAAYMRDEHGTGLDVMRQLKHMFDPNNILNPGKIFPEK
jgi:D-lactate dehydrogenase (cytochrome)